MGRLIERVMSQQLGQKIIVDNRPGANGFSAPHSWPAHRPTVTSIFTTVSAPVTNALNAPISYDVETAFQPISRVMASPFFLVVPESSN